MYNQNKKRWFSIKSNDSHTGHLELNKNNTESHGFNSQLLTQTHRLEEAHTVDKR